MGRTGKDENIWLTYQDIQSAYNETKGKVRIAGNKSTGFSMEQWTKGYS